MELSQDEKDRIIAEEKLRFETKSQLWRESWGGGWGGGQNCGPGWYGWGHRRYFWKGFLVGVLATVVLGCLLHHHRNCHRRFCPGPQYGWNQPSFQYPPVQPVPQAAPQK